MTVSVLQLARLCIDRGREGRRAIREGPRKIYKPDLTLDLPGFSILAAGTKTG